MNDQYEWNNRCAKAAVGFTPEFMNFISPYQPVIEPVFKPPYGLTIEWCRRVRELAEPSKTYTKLYWNIR